MLHMNTDQLKLTHQKRPHNKAKSNLLLLELLLNHAIELLPLTLLQNELIQLPSVCVCVCVSVCVCVCVCARARARARVHTSSTRATRHTLTAPHTQFATHPLHKDFSEFLPARRWRLICTPLNTNKILLLLLLLLRVKCA